MKPILKSSKLANVCYDIRGPVLDKARQMEEEGHKIIKLNIGNLAVFGLEPPDEIVQDMIRNLPHAAGYTDSKGLFAPRKAVVHYTQEKHIAGVDGRRRLPGQRRLRADRDEPERAAQRRRRGAGAGARLPAVDRRGVAVRRHAGALPVRRAGRTGCPTSTTSARKITPRTRGIVVINPNNPTGALYPDELLLQIVELARQHQLIVFADEIYDKTLYDGNTHTSIASLADDVLFVTFNGLSKNYRSCGYRAGWMVVSGDKRHARRLHRGPEHAGLDAAVRQHAGAAGDPDRAGRLPEHQGPGGAGRAPVPPARPGLRAADRRFRASACVKPKAALYMFPRLDPKIYPIADDQQFAYELLAEEKVLIVQGTGFNWPTPDHFRIVFLPNSDDLSEAIGRIARFLDHYRKRHSQ